MTLWADGGIGVEGKSGRGVRRPGAGRKLKRGTKFFDSAGATSLNPSVVDSLGVLQARRPAA